MKKRILLLVCLSLFIGLFIYFEKNKNYDNYEIIMVDNLEEDSYKSIKICLLNQENKLEVISVKVNKNVDEFTYILKLFDEYRNSLPLDYKTVLFENLNVKAFQKNYDNLYIEIEKLGKKTNLNDFLVSLMWSYRYLGIKSIDIKIGKFMYHIDENININPIFLTTSSQFHQVYYEITDNGFIPYTVFHEMSCEDFIMKMAGISDSLSYEIVKDSNNLYLYFKESV